MQNKRFTTGFLQNVGDGIARRNRYIDLYINRRYENGKQIIQKNDTKAGPDGRIQDSGKKG